MARETRLRAKFKDDDGFKAKFKDDEGFNAKFGNVIKIHTDNYEDLYNKPRINEVELVGNKTFEDLGDKPLSNFEIKAIHDRVFGN